MLLKYCNKLIGCVLIILFTASLAAQTKQNVELSEEEKINYLINQVRQLKGAEFIRNGSSHTAKEAADHLAMKRKKAGSKVITVDQFIERVASGSSISGQPYKIKLANGEILLAKDYYYACLKKLQH